MKKRLFILISLVAIFLAACNSDTGFEGKILAYESEDDIILVENKSGELHQFHLTDSTIIEGGEKTEFTAGMNVKVEYKDTDTANPPNSNAEKIIIEEQNR